MRIKRAEELSKLFADFIGESVAITHESWTHRNITYSTTNGIPKTTIRFSYFTGKDCNQREFSNLDEVEKFINNRMNWRKQNEILFRRFA